MNSEDLQKEILDNAALEGFNWSLEERWNNLESLYQRFQALNPYPQKPLVKSFNSFSEYETWRQKQKSPWYW